MVKGSKEPDQGGLWDDPDVVPTIYIDAEAAREERATTFGKFQEELLDRPLISGHNLHVEIVSATIDGDQISLSYKVHGIVQRPGTIAVPEGKEERHLKIPARLTRVATSEEEWE